MALGQDPNDRGKEIRSKLGWHPRPTFYCSCISRVPEKLGLRRDIKSTLESLESAIATVTAKKYGEV